MNSFSKLMQLPIIWLTAMLFIIFYPMLISIYVFLPLFVGVMGYLLMKGIDENRIFYILLASLYFINLEVNLSLPFFLTTLTSLLVYVFFYHHLNYFRKCVICRPILSVILIDVLYLLSLLAYDFVFQTHTIVLDNILLYSLIVDLLVVVVL
ncbi:MAG: hypothetical protein J7J02_09005 [Sulfurovum sp.]|nr:hypothetical protein [Sulfurovum sp.]